MTAQTYAHALVEAANGKDAHEVAQCVARFRELLGRNGHVRLLPRIVVLVERMVEKDTRKEQVELSVARKAEANRFAVHIADYRQSLDVQERAGIRMRLDDTLIGGFRLRVKGAMINATYKRALFELYRVLTANSR